MCIITGMSILGRESARAARLSSTDARAVTTQRLLVEALSQVVRKEGFDKISATRIAQEAGLSRSGFYEHFASVDDLAYFMLDELLVEATARDLQARIAHGPEKQNQPEFALELLLKTILEERTLYEHILLSNRAGSIISRVMERFARSAQPVVALARPGLSESRKDLYAAAVGGVVLGVVMHCLRTGEQKTARELTQEIIEAMPAWMYPPGNQQRQENN